MMQQGSRPMAPLPHHPPQPPSQQYPNPNTPRQQPSVPQKRSFYSVDTHDLHSGPKNRLFLSLRSTIPSEVDYALPRLVLGSYENLEAFKLETWLDSMTALQYWPDRWVESLEKEAALAQVREGNAEASGNVRSIIPEWTRDRSTEERATSSLLILRNASVMASNARFISRPSFHVFLSRVLSLPTSFLLDLSLRTPEPLGHILMIVQSFFSVQGISVPNSFIHLVYTALPPLLVQTRDSAMLQSILPTLIHIGRIPNLPPPTEGYIPHLLYLLTVNPPTPILEYTLDLFISLTLQQIPCKTILSDPSFPAHLKTLVLLLDHGSKPTVLTRDVPGWCQGVLHKNPASLTAIAEEASQRRAMERDSAGRMMEMYGGRGVEGPVASSAPNLPPATRTRLYQMAEPSRSIAWMHETFVYSSGSQLLQVTFWHSYKDFFSNPGTAGPLLSAAEVIRNVAIAFPGASAKVWHDASGQPKFVIAGMGFRKPTDDEDRFICHWKACPTPRSSKSAAELFTHVRTHLPATPSDPSALEPSMPPVSPCLWRTCTVTNCTLSHLLTHLPIAHRPTVPEMVLTDSRVPDGFLMGKKITNRPPPPLPKTQPLYIEGKLSQVDQRNQPMGVSFLSALTIRNLAKTLRNEIQIAEPSSGMSKEAKEMKKKQLQEERFGLPIPEAILREEEEEEKENIGESDEGLTAEERDRARDGFCSVEDKVLRVAQDNVNGIGQYLGEAFGW